MGLDGAKIKKCSDLAKTFMKQYQLSLELVVDRITLQSMKKRASKTIEEYVQRYKEIVTQFNPPLVENKMIFIFMNTFEAFDFGYMICNTSK